MTVSLQDIDQWSFEDLMQAHDVLDALELAEAEAAEDARART